MIFAMVGTKAIGFNINNKRMFGIDITNEVLNTHYLIARVATAFPTALKKRTHTILHLIGRLLTTTKMLVALAIFLIPALSQPVLKPALKLELARLCWSCLELSGRWS